MTGDAPEPIDIYNHAQKYEKELIKLDEDERLPEQSRQVIRRFLQDARTGRTVRCGARKRLSVGRCRKLLYALKRFAILVKVPIEEVSVADMERVVLGMEDGIITKNSSSGGSGSSGGPYSKETVSDFKKILRKFYRWLLATDLERFEELTGWFDTREIESEVRTFTLADAQRMARVLGCPQGQALIMLLFDGGPRASELFNVRLDDVTFQPDDDGVRTCFVRIRVSKTKPRTVSMPLATEAIAFWVERHPKGGRIREDGTIDAKDGSAQLIQWSPEHARKVIREVGRSELGERLYFHRFRHSSATHYAKLGLSEYQMCARYGWVIGSKVPGRYVELSQINAAETAVIARRAMQEKPGTRNNGSAIDVEAMVERLRSNPELAVALRAVLG